MKKICTYLCLLLVVVSAFYVWDILSDKEALQENIIRLHVVANSDSEQDQSIKLHVRDAITEYLQETMKNIPNAEQAKQYLKSQLPRLEAIANKVLKTEESLDFAKVSLSLEEFGTRVYDTFTLPAGVYDALKITIGKGEGKNWWCVVFPSFCLPATTDGFQDVAVSSGFSDSLTGALTQQGRYQVRFFLLDCMGKLQNFFFS